MAVNNVNTHIRTYRTWSLTLNLGLRRSFSWVFIVAEVQKPIIGADFLRHFGLLVDMKQCQLSDAATCLYVQGIASPDTSPSPFICPKDTDNPTPIYWQSSQHSPRYVPQTLLLNMTSSTTLKQQVPQSQPALDAFHQIASM